MLEGVGAAFAAVLATLAQPVEAAPARVVPIDAGFRITTGWLEPGRCRVDPGKTVAFRVGSGTFTLDTRQVRAVVLAQANVVRQRPDKSLEAVLPSAAGCPESPLAANEIAFLRPFGPNLWPFWLTATPAGRSLVVDDLLRMRERTTAAAAKRTFDSFPSIAEATVVNTCFRLPDNYFGCSAVEPSPGGEQLVPYAFSADPGAVLTSGAPEHTKCGFTTRGAIRKEIAAGQVRVTKIVCGIGDRLPCDAQFETTFPGVPSTGVIRPALRDTKAYVRGIAGATC